MLKSDFYYELPEELIAQTPFEPRDSSRLMVYNRSSGALTHDYFYNIAEYLRQGDLLVMNDSKVFPARLYAENAEVLLLEERLEPGRDKARVWECIGRNLKRGRTLDFGEGLTAEVMAVLDDGNRLVRFEVDGDFFETLDKVGNMPLPPYITQKLRDNDRYNTIYADKTGSAAAPTAGLHFTERVFDRLSQKGIDTAYVTLHVGLGTFRPVKSEKLEEHKMHSERYYLPVETARKISRCKERGGRVIAVGTTACRVLEAARGTWAARETGVTGKNCDSPVSGTTDIFITPGYRFAVMDALVTNFHLPESTLLMLVSAVMGREAALAAYAEAIRERYRFFSFGDCMLVS